MQDDIPAIVKRLWVDAASLDPHQVCTVMSADLRALLTAYQALRRAHAERGEALKRVMGEPEDFES